MKERLTYKYEQNVHVFSLKNPNDFNNDQLLWELKYRLINKTKEFDANCVINLKDCMTRINATTITILQNAIKEQLGLKGNIKFANSSDEKDGLEASASITGLKEFKFFNSVNAAIASY